MQLEVAFIALNRFGLGARPGELAELAANPQDWVSAQLHAPEVSQIAGIPDTPARFHQLEAYRKAKAEADRAQAAREAAGATAAAAPAAAAVPAGPLATPPGKMVDVDFTRRAEHMVGSSAPVLERLVAFWSNHFNISTMRDEIAVITASYENEAIRPNLFGSFRDMLGATAQHPAMQYYLDQASSLGPDSFIGQRRHRSDNENYAREIMELHTLGVHGGYTQADVQSLALTLTGWGVDAQDGEPAWFPQRHQPGMRKLLGRALPDGPGQAAAALDLLANHPATARHVCTKLAAHFCGDHPPQSVVARLVAAWRASHGNLRSLYLALAASPEAWARRAVKYRTPQDFVLAAARGLGLAGHGMALVQEMRNLGQGPFRAPAPTGWSDADADWIDPAGVMGRVASAARLAGLIKPTPDAMGLLGELVPIHETSPTLEVLGEEHDPVRALTLAFAAPEFQRR